MKNLTLFFVFFLVAFFSLATMGQSFEMKGNNMKIFLLALFFFFFSSFSKSQWGERHLPLDIKVTLGIDFINQNHGITGGFDGSLPHIYGKVFYTNDKGLNWSEALISDSMRVMVRVQMINEMIAYGVGAYNLKVNKANSNSNQIQNQNINNSISKYYETIGIDLSGEENYRGYFVESTNGGLSWHPKGRFEDSVYYLQELYFINQENGFVIGATHSPQTNAILKTTDSGNNWSYVFKFQAGNIIRDIQFFDEQNGIATGENWITRSGFVLNTTDGGTNWQTIQIPQLRSVTKCAYKDSSTIFISAETTQGFGTIYKSSDRGLTWQPFRNYSDSYTRGVETLPNKEMILVYGYSFKDNSPILFTDISLNNGVDWKYSLQSEFTGYIPINSKILNEAMYIIGYTRNDNGFFLFENNTEFLTDVKQNSNMPNEFSLAQNYPNPFNPSTKINFSIPQASFVNLKVYDILGNEVVTLVNEEKPTGSYEVNFSAKGGSASDGNANSLSSGVYFYKLQAGSFVETRKMLLLK